MPRSTGRKGKVELGTDDSVKGRDLGVEREEKALQKDLGGQRELQGERGEGSSWPHRVKKPVAHYTGNLSMLTEKESPGLHRVKLETPSKSRQLQRRHNLMLGYIIHESVQTGSSSSPTVPFWI